MHALGFLRKKRTRNGNPGPSSPSSNPTSPVSPTPTSSLDQTAASCGSSRSGAASSQSSSRSSASATQPNRSAEAAGEQRQQHPMNNLSVQQPPYLAAYQTPSPGTEPQNLPRIANLINPPQHDGSVGYQQPGVHYVHSTANWGSGVSQASPMHPPQPHQHPQNHHHHHNQQPQQHEQQQHQYQHTYQQQEQHHEQNRHEQQIQQQHEQQHQHQHQHQHQQQGPQQSQQQQQQQQPQPQPQHQHQQQQPQTRAVVQQDQPRVTKGKYSLADFHLLRTLGTGSFGRVHLVQSRHNNRFYAIKVLKKAQVVRMKQVEHTNDERRMLGEVKHPFLITLWGTFQDAKNLYMVMDFVEGGELFSLLRRTGRFPNTVAKFYAAEVTLALEYLHSRNIVYRDLKPENLLLDRYGHLKITDFGFAKRVPDKTWTLCGTPDYLAPEVVSNKGYNKSVDWWSLGILIYEMLCGYTPFWDSGSPMKIYENILRGRVRYPPHINPDAQDLLERLITADLTKRLGNLYGGPQDIKNHPWFAEVLWDRLAQRDIDAPYLPPIKAGMGDTSQFDRYPEETEQYGQPGPDEHGHLFEDF